MPIRNPRWVPPQVIVLTQDHMGKYRNIFFSETIALIEPKLCINHWKVLYKLRVFYVDRNSKMTTTAGHSFYIGPIGSFYNQVNDTALESLWFLIISEFQNILSSTFVTYIVNTYISFRKCNNRIKNHLMKMKMTPSQHLQHDTNLINFHCIISLDKGRHWSVYIKYFSELIQ